MKSLYLLKSLIYMVVGLYFIDTRVILVPCGFLAILMLFFWLDLTIKDHINELKNDK